MKNSQAIHQLAKEQIGLSISCDTICIERKFCALYVDELDKHFPAICISAGWLQKL
jgi:hypothetical protein